MENDANEKNNDLILHNKEKETEDMANHTDNNGFIISDDPVREAIDMYKKSLIVFRPTLNTIIESVKTISLGISYELPKIIETAKILNESTRVLTDSIKSVVALGTAVSSLIKSPAIDFLRNLDFSSFEEIWKKVQIGKDMSLKYRDILLQAMYDIKWFPYVVSYANFSLLTDINEIICTTRGPSKNREKRIDKVIFDYFNTSVIREIKKSWWKSELDYHVKRMICQTIEAYIRGEYALTICCLATMWEGLIKKKMPPKKRKNDELKKDINELVVDNGFRVILGEFYNKLIIGTCYRLEDVVEGIPNRNGIAHSWFKKYPNKKSALNAILITDFIIKLQPM